MKKWILVLLTLWSSVLLSQEISYRNNTFEKLPAPSEEVRGVWIASVVNLNWPSSPGLSIEEQKREYEKLLDKVKYMNMNTVIVQVRPTGDGFYPSELVPWSRYLTGEQGGDPGYDPLAYMIEEAHKRNLEFHAWFNPFRVAVSPGEYREMSQDNFAVKNPETVIRYGNNYYLDAGIPEVREHVVAVFEEVVKNYHIDAVHIDDYFYPYTIAGKDYPDEKTYSRYGQEYKDIEEWRRANVNTFIEDLYARIKAADPRVAFGVSPFGVWRNKDADERGSDTRAYQTSYDNLYADILHWIDKGWIDYVVPQIYWNFGFDAAPYEVLIDWWKDATRGRDTRLYIGQGAYKMNTRGWEKTDELINQIHYNRYHNIEGSFFFSIDSLINADNDIVERIRRELYTSEADLPGRE